MTKKVTKCFAPLNQFVKNEAETIAWSEGVKSMRHEKFSVFVTAPRNGAYTKVKGVGLRKTEVSKLNVILGTTHNSEVNLEVRFGSVKGEIIGTLKAPLT